MERLTEYVDHAFVDGLEQYEQILDEQPQRGH